MDNNSIDKRLLGNTTIVRCYKIVMSYKIFVSFCPITDLFLTQWNRFRSEYPEFKIVLQTES
jgi:hypothetical protein